MMERIKQGAKGGFSGKAGSVIGSSWKNIEYSKDEPKTSHKYPSQRQLEQLAKFGLAVRFLKPVKNLLIIICGSIKEGRATGFNIAIRMRMVAVKLVPLSPKRLQISLKPYMWRISDSNRSPLHCQRSALAK